ncbi:hypothetical protein [Nocardia salmonicida]|uniref:hypothetical protein n=1 Tax=Nocardia salmonicida TaxID=53431 RepID=UPI0033DA7C97
MTEDTPGKSRSGKNQPNSHDDVGFDIVMHGAFTFSGRKMLRKLKKLKWPAVAIGFVLCVLFGQQYEIEVHPGAPTPVQISRYP